MRVPPPGFENGLRPSSAVRALNAPARSGIRSPTACGSSIGSSAPRRAGWPGRLDPQLRSKQPPGLMPAYKRILLKLSGEALMGDDAYGINRSTIVRMVHEIRE